MQFISHSVDQTQLFAEKFASTLVGGEVLLLDGDMGAGKTHFVKGLALGLGISDVITSPTFALHNAYQGKLQLNHFDFYRIDDPAEAEMLGLDEFFYQKNGVCAVEWWQNVADLIPKSVAIKISITKLSETSRQISVEKAQQ